MGLRDHAILQLLATYGLRSSEVRNLRLEDIDWRAESIRIRHTKTRACSFLPLMEPVGEAVLAYLRSGRPATDAREIFIRTRAPYRKLGMLASAVRRRLRDAGVEPPGKSGPHIFRHARAVEMLRASVPQKVIGDLLGHRSAEVDGTLPQARHRGSPGHRTRRAGTGGAVMTTWPDPERLLIARYLAGLGLRSTNSRTYYKQVLHSFQDVAERHAELGQDVLVAWLRASSDHWAARRGCTAPALSTGSSTHLVQTRAIDRNPVVALREACNIKQCKPVWRALASRDPDSALAELHQPRPFGSVLGEIMAEHVTLMRNRGYKYTSQPMWLSKTACPLSG